MQCAMPLSGRGLPLKEKVSITLDCDIIRKVKSMAENDDRSFSQYVNLVLRKHINDKDDNGVM